MRVRESKPTIEESMATALEIDGRPGLVRHIFDALAKKGVVVTDEMIHVSHYGFDERIDWDEHIIVVDRLGVFGFTDGPCPYALHADAPSLQGAINGASNGAGKATAITADQFSAETESAYGLVK